MWRALRHLAEHERLVREDEVHASHDIGEVVDNIEAFDERIGLAGVGQIGLHEIFLNLRQDTPSVDERGRGYDSSKAASARQ